MVRITFIQHISVALLFSLFLVGCGMEVPLPKDKFVKEDSKNLEKNRNYKQTLPSKMFFDDISLIEVGDKNLYGIEMTPALYKAYQGYLKGDIKKAKEGIRKNFQEKKSDKHLWQGSFLKIQILIMAGLGDDAQDEVALCKRYEEKAFGSNLNCSALEAELLVWLGDFEKAKKRALLVLATIGDWELPISYMSPPSNMGKLVAVTTAQIRAYTSLSALYNLQEDYKNSFYYANEAEKRFNSVFYVANHWLYGNFLNLHLDSYYGRANNLLFLGSSKHGLGYKEQEVEKDYSNAITLFNKIGYKKGVATVLAIKARVFNRLGQHERCYEAGKVALDFALKHNFYDFVWRIEALRGETFTQLNRFDEAKRSYRTANQTINLLSGALDFDISKQNFGAGKEEITYNLLQFSIKEKNYQQLFKDLETNRARAFVDMLAKSRVTLQDDALKEIYTLDKNIQEESIALSATIAQDSKLNRLLKQREKLLLDLQKRDKKLSSTIAIWSNSIEQTQKLLGLDEKIVYFLPLKSADIITYLEISKKDVKVKKLNISYKDLRVKLERLGEIVGVEKELARGLKVTHLVSSKSVSQPVKLKELIASLQRELDIANLFDYKRNYVISSASTSFVPWSMLETKKEIVGLTTASWLLFGEDKRSYEKEALVVANPDFSGELSSLPGAEDEGEFIGKLTSADLIKGKLATKEAFLSKTKRSYKFIHLATHGVFRYDDPMKSAIYFSKKDGADPLTVEEIYQNKISADLLVLSACETGIGKAISGDDMQGLQRAFLLQGTNAMITSLWPIDDRGTQEFMAHFYQNIQSGYATSFQKSVDFLKQRNYPPQIYGAFVLTGTGKR